MKLELSEDVKQNLDKLLSKFSYSCMNNSKWKKVFIEILRNNEFIKRCEIYDYINPNINELLLDNISESSFEEISSEYISEKITTGEYSTPYKYIEYIEFLKKWENKPYALAKTIIIKQDTDKIKEILSKMGLFEWEEDNNSLKLLGYKK